MTPSLFEVLQLTQDRAEKAAPDSSGKTINGTYRLCFPQIRKNPQEEKTKRKMGHLQQSVVGP